MNIVLGSGPASVFCALSLLESGAQVLMIDPGEVLEADRSKVVQEASRKEKNKWDDSLFRLIRENTNPNVKGLPKKLVYGSDFPFRWREDDVSVRQKGVDTLMSHALGGLSNAWGANIFPLLAQDTDTWPVTMQDLGPYYEKVSRHLPVSADDTLPLFPIYGQPTALPQSRQAKTFLHDAHGHKDHLASLGMTIGRSRLAVDASRCVACGLCLYGCPHGLIYSAAQSLSALQRFEKFQYRKGALAKTFGEKNGSVSVVLRDIATGAFATVSCDRLFVGCGAVNSTALFLRSIQAYDTEIQLKDSQYFLTPYLRFSGAGDVLSEELHTLSQLALEIVDPAFCDRSVHVLFYTYNDMYRRALEGMFGPAAPLVRPLLRMALGRLIIMQGYLHSDYSGSVGVRLEKNALNNETLVLSAHENAKTRALVGKIHKKMTSLWNVFRGVPVQFMSHIGAPGKSYHLGGSLPMSRTPKQFETDLLGRPQGFEKVHLVDASIFPNVPATNVTLTAMANAFRIGQQAL